MSGRISVCVIARDEEHTLARCLDSVAWSDEVVVVIDARSRDSSEKIALERAQRVVVRDYEGNLQQKKFCVGLATGDWVLSVDADEVVSPALAREIRSVVLDSTGGCRGYEINRQTQHLGRWIRHGDFYPDWTLRLFQLGAARWVGENPHGRVAVEGRVGRLDGPLEHYSYRDLSDQVERIQLFSSEAARALHAAGRRPAWSDLVLRPPARFLRAYLLKGGFRDGWPGFIIAGATAFSVLLKYAKLWELWQSAAESGRTDHRDS